MISTEDMPKEKKVLQLKIISAKSKLTNRGALDLGRKISQSLHEAP